MGVDGIPFIKRERMETINFLSGAFDILHEQNHNNHQRESERGTQQVIVTACKYTNDKDRHIHLQKPSCCTHY